MDFSKKSIYYYQNISKHELYIKKKYLVKSTKNSKVYFQIWLILDVF